MSSLHAVLSRDTLRALVDAVKPAAGRSTVNVTEYLLLESRGAHSVDLGKLSATGTDLALRLTSAGDAAVHAPGAICVPAKTLAALLPTLPAGDVTLQASDTHRLTVRYGRGQTTLHGLAPEDYPRAPTVDNAQALTLDAALLAHLLSVTLPAASTDETRYHIAGVHLEREAGNLVAVSTDGHRLHVARAHMPDSKPTLSVTIPRRSAIALSQALRGVSEPVSLEIGARHASLALPTLTLTTQLVDGTFPDWRQVVPTTEHCTVRLPSAALLAAVKRVALLAGDKSWGVLLAPEEGGLSLSSDNPDLGEAREVLDCEGAVPCRTGLNARYLQAAVEAVGVEEVVLAFQAPEGGEMLAPVTVRTEAESGPVCVVMPMRV